MPIWKLMAVITFMAAGMAWSQDLAEPNQEKGASMQKITGSFEVKLAPLGESDQRDGATLGSMSIDKTYSGPLQATAKGQMLTAMTQVKGSAAYVAIEHVSGSLNGKEGSFTLQHHAWMAGGSQHLEISVVPDSGTGALKGLRGKMNIRIEEGQHFYDLEYSLPES